MTTVSRKRLANAFAAMKQLGIDQETVRPILKRLFNLYDRNWELIEEDNYRTLVDAIFEEQDDKLKVEKNGDVMDIEIEPPPKRQQRGDSNDWVMPNGEKGKDIADLEEDEVPKSMARLPRPDSGGGKTVPSHNCVSESPSGSKSKTPIKVNSSIHPTSNGHYDNQEIDDHVAVDHRHKNAIVPWEQQTIDLDDEAIVVSNNDRKQQSIGLHNGAIVTSNNDRKQQSIDLHNGAIVTSNNDRKRVFHKAKDITKGTEKVEISLLDEIGSEDLPDFVYCPHNLTYESAYVHVSLARISDEDCCADCVGNCLSASIPCACARDTGGEFAYTPEGLLNPKLLKTCINLKNSTDVKDMLFCQVCPLERAKNARNPGKCEGHVLRKFIKECWRKCGCDMMCGNRVVQRGISRNLQVFLTSEGKGWGLRTLEDLPKGAFVCEYVGEILTNIELYDRNMKSSGKDKHVYPVLLDSDWTTEGTLKDEEALCLDATHYGNVARFINHRCFDGNLIEVPVQVETPDRHYYHVAFFTTRKVNALEELTWDYQIDFNDKNHPIKAFKCRCGSKYCRNN